MLTIYIFGMFVAVSISLVAEDGWDTAIGIIFMALTWPLWAAVFVVIMVYMLWQDWLDRSKPAAKPIEAKATNSPGDNQ